MSVHGSCLTFLLKPSYVLLALPLAWLSPNTVALNFIPVLMTTVLTCQSCSFRRLPLKRVVSRTPPALSCLDLRT